MGKYYSNTLYMYIPRMSVGFKNILGCYKDSASLEIDMYIWKWNDRWISESKSIHILPLYVAIRSWLQTSYRITRATYFFMYLLCWMQTYDNQISLKKYYYLLVGDQFFLHFSIQSHSRYYIRRLSHIPFPTLTRERRCSFFKWVLRKIILFPWSICRSRRKIVWKKVVLWIYVTTVKYWAFLNSMSELNEGLSTNRPSFDV